MILSQVWQKKMFDLRTWTAGMCYTYNPPNKSDTLLTSRFHDGLTPNRVVTRVLNFVEFPKQADWPNWWLGSVDWVGLPSWRFLQNTRMTMTCKMIILFRFWCLPPWECTNDNCMQDDYLIRFWCLSSRERPILAKARLFWPWRQGIIDNHAYEGLDKQNLICDNDGKSLHKKAIEEQLCLWDWHYKGGNSAWSRSGGNL